MTDTFRPPRRAPIPHAAGRFVVHTPDRRVHDETDAAGALRIVLAGLPGQ
ncbi:hypothetical protein [Catenuloplanes indicus]|uniref:Uncharacterized protein n=1 Tax=Catenuloplanes indicus TaxID=137267 RepID=A0AAE4B159_9ACTN|nr:hypothetical protein [Catenuloplanes indicus]MDQ0370292.1 hypothetical protein [Catenuloplanes indicus]